MSADLDDTTKTPVEKLSVIRRILKRLLETYDRAAGKRSSGELISQLDVVFATLSSILAHRLRTTIGSMDAEDADTFEAKVNECIEEAGFDLDSDGAEFIKGFVDFLEEFEDFAEDEENTAAIQGDADALAAALVGAVYEGLRPQFSALMAARETGKRSIRRVAAALTKKTAKRGRPELNVNNLGDLFAKMKTA